MIKCSICGGPIFLGQHTCSPSKYCNVCKSFVFQPHFCPAAKPLTVRVETPVMHMWRNFVVIRTKSDDKQPVGTYFEKYDEALDYAVKMTEETRLGHTVYALAIAAQARPQAPAVDEYGTSCR